MPQPRDVERPYASGELFFSTTDRKGVIQSGNDVFVRVSGHSRDELVGSAHNIIRHPDMPKAVFKLLWDYNAASKPFAGYVKNMSADGAYYWVMALVVPIADGYLSIRFKPSSRYFPVVRNLYADLLATEQRVGADRTSWREGMQQAGAQLTVALRKLGFSGYDEFMYTAFATELSSHRPAADMDVVRGRRGRVEGGAGRLQELLTTCRKTDEVLSDVFAHVDGVVAATTSLDEKAAFLRSLSSDVHLVSLNALIASSRLQRQGAGLSVVTQSLATLSGESTHTIDTMTRELLGLTASLRETAFSITAAKLQIEMTVFFLRELSASEASHDEAATSRTDADILTLARSLCDSSKRLADALPRARQPLQGLLRLQNELHTDLRRLSCVHVTGKIQTAGIENATQLRDLLDQIQKHLQASTSELDGLADGLLAVCGQRLPTLERDASGVVASVTGFHDLVSARA